MGLIIQLLIPSDQVLMEVISLLIFIVFINVGDNEGSINASKDLSKKRLKYNRSNGLAKLINQNNEGLVNVKVINIISLLL